MTQTVATLGADRVLDPAGALPQAAARLDAGGPVRSHEIEIDVESLYLDSTSFAQLRRAAEGDAAAVARSIEAIVAERGKMHNPVTGSGGVLVGTVTAAGDAYPDPPAPGTRVVTLASLSLTPLRLDAVGPVDVASPRVPARGRAHLPSSAPWTAVPGDLPLATVLATLDVYGSPSHTRRLSGPGDTVVVLGAGHAGLLSLVAARDAVGPDGRVVAVDADPAACERARGLGVCDTVVTTDLRRPLTALEDLAAAGVPPADLCVVVVNATGCELSAVLATADSGTVLYFSMATSFTAAALGGEGVSSAAALAIGSGYADDRGAYALDLVRREPELARLLGGEEGA